MSIHYHLVLRVNRPQADRLDTREVIDRWGRLVNMPMPVARHIQGEPHTEVEILLVEQGKIGHP